MKKGSGKKLVAIVFYVLLLIFIMVAAVLAYRLSRTKEEITVKPNFNLVPGTDEDEKVDNLYEFETMQDPSSPFEDLESLEKANYKDSEYVHYLILGVDTRSSEKLSKSDAIIILSINEETERVVLTSVPRDTYVYIKGKGWDKIAYAYAYGKAALVKETLEFNYDLTFSGYFTIGFKGLEDIVDELGGLEITLTKEESEHMSSFYGVEGTHAGVNLLNGLQTITYCRISKIDSDFERTTRQYNVLCAIYDKFKGVSTSYYPKLVSKFYDYINTDCSTAECIDIVTAIYEQGFERLSYRLMFTKDEGSGRNINGVYYFVLDDMQEVVTNWHRYLGEVNYTPSKTVKALSSCLSRIKG